MRFFQILSLASLASIASAQTTLTVNTPAGVLSNLPLLLSWSGGTRPYFVSILPGNAPGAAALQDLGEQTGTSVVFTVNFDPGTSLLVTLRDSTGATAQSGVFTVQAQ